jgi:hypothetical protein
MVATMSVSMRPGVTVLTVTPMPLSSLFESLRARAASRARVLVSRTGRLLKAV